MGERFLAKDNEKAYNALSVISQYRCSIKSHGRVPPRLLAKAECRFDGAAIPVSFDLSSPRRAALFQMVKACFVQRRKTLYNNLQAWLQDKEQVKQMLEKANIDPSIRAQQLKLEDFIRLYEENYETIRASQNQHRAEH